jgi:thiol-disulfide isomerase/thioredoxin
LNHPLRNRPEALELTPAGASVDQRIFITGLCDIVQISLGNTLPTFGRSCLTALLLALFSNGLIAAEFRVADTVGVSHSLAQYQGKWVLVNFWATWCPPCLAEIPEFSALYQSRKNKDLMVLGIAVDFDDPKLVFEFAERQKMSYPLILGDDEVTAQFGKINVLPTTFLYDPKGKKVLHRIGPLTRAELEKLIGK